ncbi:transposase [Streptomyces sp. NPDC058145]|uniref:transposase n=1 Tax=Streptomyces sp. NPDC058145 TaxID=3346356 RepID=UPI0036ECD7E2
MEMVDRRGRPRPLGAGDVAVRCRIDFKYALGLELEDPGFHDSVLSDFRDRLAEGDRADRLLGLALTRIRRAGFLKGRGTQRAERYGRPVRLFSQPSHPVARLAQVGADAREPLGRLHVSFPGSALPAQAEVLRQILVQHFLVWTRRGDTRWTGYLVHVIETCGAKRVNVITDVATAVSGADSQALPGIHARLRRLRLRLLPGKHLVDSGYTSVAAMDDAARLHRVTLIGPLPPSTTPQHRATSRSPVVSSTLVDQVVFSSSPAAVSGRRESCAASSVG